MNTRRQLTTVLAVSTGALLVVASVAVLVLAMVRGDITRMSQKTSPLQVKFARLQSGFERVSADFTRMSSATEPAELAAVEADTEATLNQIAAVSEAIARMEGAQDSSALKNLASVHDRLKEIADERIRARRQLADSSKKLADELDAVSNATGQLAKSMEALEKSSESALQSAKKTTQEANASIKSMLVLRENCEKLRGLIQETRLVQKKYRLNVSKDKVKAVLSAMAAQEIADRKLSGDLAKFTAAFNPAFDGPNGILTLRAVELDHPQDTKANAAFETALKALDASVDGMSSKVSETIDPLELAVRNANVGMNQSTEMMMHVGRIMGTTANVNAQARSLQALALQLIAASSEEELNRAAESIRTTANRAVQSLRDMRGELNTLKRSRDVQDVDTCTKLFQNVLTETTGNNGMGELIRSGLAKQSQAEQLFREALSSTQAVTSQGSVKTREAENAQASAVTRIEHVSNFAFAAILLLGSTGLIAAWTVGRRVRASILAGEQKIRSIVNGLRAMVQQVRANAKSLRAASADLTSTSEVVAHKLDSIMHGNTQMQQSIEVVGKSINQVVTVGTTASQVAERAAAAIAALRTSSESIEAASQKIRGISFQTNLLALNATIEAAHAGQAGLGFAVVAGEVKNLAATSAAMTDEIDTCTSNMRDEVARVIRSITEIQDTITEIRELQSSAATAIDEHANKARKMIRDVSETAATCNGTDGKAGVLDMAKQLAAMAESLDEVCRQGVGRRN